MKSHYYRELQDTRSALVTSERKYNKLHKVNRSTKISRDFDDYQRETFNILLEHLTGEWRTRKDGTKIRQKEVT